MKKILFIVTLFIFCIGLCCITNMAPDNDLWARLTAGCYIVEKHNILRNDFLSYTQTHPWYDHEWGASIFFYLVLKYFGTNGLIILKGILSALTVFFCYKTVEIRKPQSTHAYNILYFAFMFWVASNSIGLVVRCLLFTCLFFSIFLYILERYRYNGGKYIVILPFLMILWGNIHGGCISGLGLLGIYIVGEFLNKKNIKPYIYVFLGCIIALFINPYGVEYVKFLFFAASMDRSMITEWITPFHIYYSKSYLRYKYYLIFIILIQIIYLVKNKITYQKLDKTKILIVLAMVYLSVTHLRHITFFVFTAGTLMYDEFYSLYKLLIERIKTSNEVLNKEISVLKEICVYTYLIILTLPPILNNDKILTITESEYPRFSIEFIKINNIKGNLFINFDWGSYAAYKLFPQNKIVMDGRYEEVYYPELLNELKNFFKQKNDWYKVVRDYKTDVMIIDRKYPIYEKLKTHPDWTNIFENNLSGVFVPSNRVKERYIYPETADEYYNNNLFETNVFDFIKNEK